MTHLLTRTLSGMLLLLSFVACEQHVIHREAIYLQSNQVVRTPLIHPLLSVNPYLDVTLEHRDEKSGTKKSLTTTFMLDTGAGNMMPQGYFEQLGASTKDYDQYSSIDAAGNTRTWNGAVLEHMKIGDVAFKDVVVGASKSKLLGRNTVNTLPWTMDLDEGVIVWNDHINAQLDKPNLAHLKFTLRDWSHFVTIELNGKSQHAVFDTGASILAISKNVIEEIGSKRTKLKIDRKSFTVFGTTDLTHYYPTKLSFAGLPTQEIPAYKMDGESRGALLNDHIIALFPFTAMTPYRWTYVPKKHVIFRPRASLVQTRRKRMERWPFVPKECTEPGCMTHSLELDLEKGRLNVEVRFEKYYRQPIIVTIGCLKEDGTVDHDVPFINVDSANASPRKPWKKSVSLADDTIETYKIKTLAGHCEKSVILDVNPGKTNRVKHNRIRVKLAPSNQMPPMTRFEYNELVQLKERALRKKRSKKNKKRAEGEAKSETKPKKEAQKTPTTDPKTSQELDSGKGSNPKSPSQDTSTREPDPKNENLKQKPDKNEEKSSKNTN